MAAYGTDGRCLMRVLQEELDDPDPGTAAAARSAPEPRFAEPPDPRLVELAQRHLRSRPIELDVRKMAPGRRDRRDAQDPRGRARRARLGARARGRRRLVAGDRARPARRRFDDEVAVALADLLRARRRRAPAWITTVPSARLRRRRCSTSPSGSPPSSASPHARADRAHRRPPAPARDGERRPAGGERARGVPGHRLTAARAPACCSTTAACPAGRSRWSAASCAAPAPRRSSR